MRESEIPDRMVEHWAVIDDTWTNRADPFVVNSLAMPHDSSMVDVTIVYPVATVNEDRQVRGAVRIDLHKVYYQSFSSGIGSYQTEVDGTEIWALCLTDRSELKDEFIAGLLEWSPPGWLPAPHDYLRHFQLGRDHHGYLHFLAVDASVRFFEVDWSPVDEPYDFDASYADHLEKQHRRSRWLVDQAHALGLPDWSPSVGPE